MVKFITKTKYLYIIVLMICLSSGLVSAKTNDPSRYANQSVLASGNWIKIKIGDTGFYKITYEKLKEWGISNPKNVKVYGYGGWQLDPVFSSTYLKDQDDLPQVSVWMSKTRDQFGAGDYILFYGKGSIKWTYNGTAFDRVQNTYSSDSYYFITESDADPKTIADVASAEMGAKVVSTFTDYYLHEKELVNITQTGSEFYGESFKSKTSQDFSVSLPGIVTSEPASVRLNFVNRSAETSSVSLSTNGTTIINSTFVKWTNTYYERGKSIDTSASSTNLTENNSINISYKQGSNADDNIYLNYFRINYTKTLKPYGAVTLFRSKDINSNLGFKISDATDKMLIFDVTSGETPSRIAANLSGTTLSFAASNLTVKEYALVDISKQIPEPTFVEKVVNQNLHALTSKNMVIIVRPALKKYAEEIAKIHEEDSGLSSLIVTAEDIYNEFSSGKPDVTAYRRFMKMFYDRAEGVSSAAPQYLLLLGDGTYDNRFVESSWTDVDKKTMLLTYQSASSLHEEYSYQTDDYIGFLDDSEGVSLTTNKMDVSIGRLPIRTDSEALSVIAKIKSYIEDSNKGIWKNNVAFVADDLIASLTSSMASEKVHVESTNKYTEIINSKFPEFIVDKIYLDSYKREVNAKGGRYPDAMTELNEKLNSGLLLLNYVGHGSTSEWSHESILNIQDIEALTNKHLPIVITATCDFGRFDGNSTSGAESFLLNKNGGAIALFTTVRVVRSSDNDSLNGALFDHMFDKEDGKPLRLGDVLRRAKAGLADENRLRFILLGDPALRLTYPSDDYKVVVSEINGTDVSGQPIQIKALGNNVVKGKIINSSNTIATDFQGVLDAVLFDSKQDLKTRGNNRDGTLSSNESVKINYTDFTNLLFSGNVTIENGEFTIYFTTPKDILYSDNLGKMNFYAYSNDKQKQALGSFTNYTVGGMDENAVEENNPPVISNSYLNRSDFSSGDKVNSTPIFFATVSDDTGINLSNGIGHNISLTIDGTVSYDLRNSFKSSDGTLKKGDVKYVIPELTEGKHNLMFKVWDLWNNSSSVAFDFEVVEDYKPIVYDLQIYGNPAKTATGTKFVFTSDINGAKVDVNYKVYSINGALLWSHDVLGTTSDEYSWDLTVDNGNQLSPGIYICRMTVSVNGGAKASKSQKLIVIN